MRIGIIGGTGMYDADFLENPQETKVHTPYGSPSMPVTIGRIEGVEVVVIPRHGKGHVHNPTNVNYRANIWAMKELDVMRIIAPCAVGSLKEEIRPGELVFTDQFVDRTTKRNQTFYDGSPVCHISMAEPFCPELRGLLSQTADELRLRNHKKGTNIVIEGPRFSSMTESNLYRGMGIDTINMTMVPEVVLAREAQICYAAVAQVTDYDNFADKPVDADEIIRTLNENVAKTKLLLQKVIPKISETRVCKCREAINSALI